MQPNLTNGTRHIFCIGECALDIIFSASTPIGTMPGGRIVNAATMLARRDCPVAMISEACADSVGNLIVSHLSDSGVDVKSIDRFTEGVSPVNLYFVDTQEAVGKSMIRYQNYPELRFDVIWPKLSQGDILIFGGYYAIDPDMHSKLAQFLKYATDLGVVIVYLPGFQPSQAPRITRVMPAILENLETASLVITRNNDLNVIFGVSHPDQCYHDHINFYCRSLINIDSDCDSISYYSGKNVTSANIPATASKSLVWNAGALAGAVKAIYDGNILNSGLDAPAQDVCRDILASAVSIANDEFSRLVLDWQKQH